MEHQKRETFVNLKYLKKSVKKNILMMKFHQSDLGFEPISENLSVEDFPTRHAFH